MNRNLILLRHAEAAEKTGTQSDFDRPLTEQGIRQATSSALYIKKEVRSVDVIVASPAVRTWQTACIVAHHTAYPEAEILKENILYEATVLDMVRVIQQLHSGFRQALLVAHNPAISYLAEWLTKHTNTGLTPGALINVHLHLGTWPELREGGGKLMHVYQP